jgi:hypothetical protein
MLGNHGILFFGGENWGEKGHLKELRSDEFIILKFNLVK